MFKFKKFNFDPENFDQKGLLEYLEVVKLVTSYKSHLFDDFAKKPVWELVLDICKKYSPFVWLIVDKENGLVAGFAYLYNVIGDKTALYSASVTTCFKKAYRGKAARLAGKMFLKYCFLKLKLRKLKAECFSSNLCVTSFLKDLNFSREGILKNETIVNKKPENLVVWGYYG